MSRTLPCAIGLESSIAPGDDIWSEATNTPCRHRGKVRLSPVARSAPTRILIAAADPLVRRALHNSLGEAGFDVVAETASAAEVLPAVTRNKAQVAVIDVMLEDGDG